MFTRTILHKRHTFFKQLYQLLLIGSLGFAFSLIVTTQAFASAPAQVTLSSPAHGALNVSTAPTLEWRAVFGAIAYEVEIYRFEGFTRIDVLRQTTLATHLLVRRPFLTSPQRRDLLTNTTYRWRVRAQNAAGNSVWSPSRTFTTMRRNVWSPFRTEILVSAPSSQTTDIKGVWVSWNREAEDWYDREQRWWVWQLRKELWWEHELARDHLARDFWSSVVDSSFFSHLPAPGFEFNGRELSIRSERPEQILVSRPYGGTVRADYFSTIRFNRVANRVPSINVDVESEITDWAVLPLFRAWIDIVRRGVSIPTIRQVVAHE